MRQVEAEISSVPVFPDCKLQKGQSVMFKNDYGLIFGPHKIIGFCKGDGLLFKYGKHIYLDFDSYWSPVAESSLSPVPCAHDWQRDGTSSGGCIGLVCTRCGEYDEKDVS
jgi:hypothetical protein